MAKRGLVKRAPLPRHDHDPDSLSVGLMNDMRGVKDSVSHAYQGVKHNIKEKVDRNVFPNLRESLSNKFVKWAQKVAPGSDHDH
jgi:hypothetical protein